MQNVFTTILMFMLGLFIAIAGFLTMLLPLVERMRNAIIYLLTEKPYTIAFIGLPVFLIGSAIILYLLVNSQKRYFYIRGGNESLQVSLSIVSAYVSDYLKRLFGLKDLACDVHCRNEKLTIHAALPYVPEDEQGPLSQRINTDIEEILLNKIGYMRQFNLSLALRVNLKPLKSRYNTTPL